VLWEKLKNGGIHHFSLELSALIGFFLQIQLQYTFVVRCSPKTGRETNRIPEISAVYWNGCWCFSNCSISPNFGQFSLLLGRNFWNAKKGEFHVIWSKKKSLKAKNQAPLVYNISWFQTIAGKTSLLWYSEKKLSFSKRFLRQKMRKTLIENVLP